MTRAGPGGTLRGCPTCGTKVSATAMGLRDYRWVNKYLPGKVGGMDLDFLLSQARTGRGLGLEFKPGGAALMTGARLTFQQLVTKGIDLWVVWEHADHVEVGAITREGEVGFVEEMTKDRLGRRIGKWWHAGFEED